MFHGLSEHHRKFVASFSCAAIANVGFFSGFYITYFDRMVSHARRSIFNQFFVAVKTLSKFTFCPPPTLTLKSITLRDLMK